MKRCNICKKVYTDNDYYCLKCNIPLTSYSDEECYKDQNEQRQDQEVLKPHCPTCGSTNVKKISDLRKAGGAIMFGLFSKTARSQFECGNCGYKW